MRLSSLQRRRLECYKSVIEVWLPGADDCGNFFEQFAFCPKSLISRAPCDIEEAQESTSRHPLALAYEFQELLEAGVVNNRTEMAW